MIASGTHLATLWEINAGQLRGCVGACCAVWLWPQDPAWWPLGVLSLLFGLGALRSFAAAWRTILDLYANERAIAAVERDAVAPKSSTVLTERALRKHGML
ncbi:MAG: hypothetical protein AAF968_05260 [Pseudomonadota bacterium]